MGHTPLSQGSPLFFELDQLLQSTVGHLLFTVTRCLPGGAFVERIYSTQPEVYTIYGQKPTTKSSWSDKMDKGEIFRANHPSEFGEHFFDLDLITSLGLGSVINIPVIEHGIMLGSLNLLHETGHYPAEIVDKIGGVLPSAIQALHDYAQSIK